MALSVIHFMWMIWSCLYKMKTILLSYESSLLVQWGELNNGELQKYLDIAENADIANDIAKDRLISDDKLRLSLILRSYLNSRNKLTTIRLLATLALRYSSKRLIDFT